MGCNNVYTTFEQKRDDLCNTMGLGSRLRLRGVESEKCGRACLYIHYQKQGGRENFSIFLRPLNLFRVRAGTLKIQAHTKYWQNA